MTHPVRAEAIAFLAASLLLSAAVVGLNPETSAVAPAGALHISADPLSIVNATPWNGQTIGSATPVIVVAYLDTNPSATVVGVIFLIDGMNLTSAGTFNRTTFALPLALELRNGPHLAAFAVFDNDKDAAFLNWTFTVDTIAPILLVTAPIYPIVPTTGILVEGSAVLANATLFAGAAPINVSATVLPLGMSFWTYPVANGSFTIPVPLTEGLNTIFVNATDRLGNFATVVKTVVRDTTRPSLVILTPTAQVSPTSTVWVSGRTDPGSFLVVNGYSVAVSPLDGTWGINLTLPDGINVITVAAADQVGNLNFAGLGILVDSDAPVVTLTSPTLALTNQDHVLVAGTVTDTRVVALLVNGIPVSWNATGAFHTTLTLPEGNDPIVVVAVDAAQHTTVVRSAVRIDTTPPVVQIATPPDGLETNQSTALVGGTVDDVNATILVNGQLLRPDASGRWQTSVALLDGGNTVRVSSVDVAGNRAATIRLHIDYFSPFPTLDNRTSANAANLDQLGAIVRFSLVGILLLTLGVEFALYSRSSRKIRETRSLLAALLRGKKAKP
jgi:hypothetical protein